MNSSSRSQVANTIHAGEFWSRCPACGDSDKNEDKAHFSVRMSDGVFGCYRCGYRGRMSTAEQVRHFGFLPGFHVDLAEVATTDDEREERYEDALDILEPGASSRRDSLLGRNQFTQGDITWDVFRTFDYPSQDEVGLLARTSGIRKRSLFFGDRGWSWADIEGGRRLISSRENPLRFVEGPYDAIHPQDICVFGFINFTTVRPFIGHDIIICPDGDIFTKPDLLYAFKRTLWSLIYSQAPKPNLLGIEYLPDGKDPDEVPVSERKFIPTAQLMRDYHLSKESNQALRKVKALREEYNKPDPGGFFEW